MRHNGGENRTHGQVEKCPRIDSFKLEPGAYEGWNGLKLSYKRNGYGKAQTFFLCPLCGGRGRYMYLTAEGFRCRECAKLNYKSQQATKTDSLLYYSKGLAYAKEHLTEPPWPIDSFSFCRWTPERPRYMHQSTYQRHLARFLWYRKQHQRGLWEDVGKITGRHYG